MLLSQRAEDQVDVGCRPARLLGLAIDALVDAVRVWRLPFRLHVEQVDEEVVGELADPLGEDAVLRVLVVGLIPAPAVCQLFPGTVSYCINRQYRLQFNACLLAQREERGFQPQRCRRSTNKEYGTQQSVQSDLRHAPKGP